VNGGKCGLADIGELVINPRRDLSMRCSIDESVSDEDAETLGEYLVGDAIDVLPEVAEASGGILECEEDEHIPSVAYGGK